MKEEGKGLPSMDKNPNGKRSEFPWGIASRPVTQEASGTIPAFSLIVRILSKPLGFTLFCKRRLFTSSWTN